MNRPMLMIVYHDRESREVKTISSDIIVRTVGGGMLKVFNSATGKILYVSPEDLIGVTAMERVHAGSDQEEWWPFWGGKTGGMAADSGAE